jgi:adenylylsulfate kinase
MLALHRQLLRASRGALSFEPAAAGALMSQLGGAGGAPAAAAAAASAPARAAATTTAGATGDVYNVGAATNIKFHEGMVDRATKERIMGQRGVVIWFTGLSGSGKSTVACTLEHALAARGRVTVCLDGDNIRHGLNSNVGFSPADREENIRRIGEVSKLFAESGVITLSSFISPYKADRARVRERLAPGDFLEVFMKIPIDVCESRDPKGLYKAARAGKIKGFTGIDDPYEAPDAAELVLEVKDREGNMASAEAMAGEILAHLEAGGYLRAP